MSAEAHAIHSVLISDLVLRPFGLNEIHSSFILNTDGILPGAMVEFKQVFYTWCCMLLLFGIGLIVRSRLKMIPGGLQNLMETIIGGLENFVVEIVGEDGRKIFPYVCVLFIFILVQNLTGLVPGCDAPTANINTNVAMAIVTFLYYHWVGLKRWKLGYVKHFMGPMLPLAPLMFPLEIISHTARVISLTLRLLGNIRGEEIVLVLFFGMAPLLSTIPIYFLFLLAKVLQAFIFFMLATIYLKGSLEHAH